MKLKSIDVVATVALTHTHTHTHTFDYMIMMRGKEERGIGRSIIERESERRG